MQNSSVDFDTPEETLAARFAERNGLWPPFDVEGVVKSLADFSEENFPYDIDGLCLDVKGRRGKPKIWVKRGLSDGRRNFTLAHEIGHIIIPWHTGTIVDELDAPDSDERSNYLRMEGEANRFAAELLMPKAWVFSLIHRAEHLQAVMKTVVEVAKVSGQAAALRVAQLGPPGYVVNTVRDGIVERSHKTAGTSARLPSRGDHIEDIRLFTFHDPQILRIGKTNYYWRKERPQFNLPPKPDRPWRDILNDIVLELPIEDRHRLKQRVNAIVGLIFKDHPVGSAIEPMYWSLLKTLENRTDHDPWLGFVLSDHRFSDYAIARLYERHIGT